MKHLLLLTILIISISSFKQQQEQKLPPGINKEAQETIEKSIVKGVDYLKANIHGLGHLSRGVRTDELVLWTLLHAGLDDKDDAVKILLEKIIKTDLNKTYSVALQAMCLSKLDKKKYQTRIAHCAQFLIDNQCDNGQWDYGNKVPLNEEIDKPKEKPPEKPQELETPDNKKKIEDIETPDKKAVEKQENQPKQDEKSNKESDNKQDDKKDKNQNTGYEDKLNPIILKKRYKGPPSGDNSNSQYAALGLKACYEAGIIIPWDVILRAQKWWASTMNPDGGWNYNRNNPKEVSYGSMTMGAIGSMIIYYQMCGLDYTKDPSINFGFKWLGLYYTYAENPNAKNMRDKDSRCFHYYYIYALERAFGLYNTEWFGNRAWYREGAEYLLKMQQADGSWSNGKAWIGDNSITDTCFAILFLRRVTKPVKPPKLTETPKIEPPKIDDLYTPNNKK